MIVSVNEVEGLCLYRSRQTNVIQVGIRYVMEIPGYSRSGIEILGALGVVLRFLTQSLRI